MGAPPQLPADFFDKPGRQSKSPDTLPPDFFDKQEETTTPKGEESFDPAASSPFFQRSTAAMEGLRKGKPLDFLGNVGAAGYELAKPEITELSMMGLGGGVLGAGRALAKGSVKPALGLAAGLGTGFAIDKAAQALGMPWYLAEALATAGGAAVGGKVGMSPEAIETLKSGGAKGFLRRWFSGPSTKEQAYEFYKTTHGYAPTTEEQKMAAEVEAKVFKKKLERQLDPKPEKDTSAAGRVQLNKQLLAYGGPSKTPRGRASAYVGGRTPPEGSLVPTPEPVEPELPPGLARYEGTKPIGGKQLLKYTPSSQRFGRGNPKIIGMSGSGLSQAERAAAEAEEAEAEAAKEAAKEAKKGAKGSKPSKEEADIETPGASSGVIPLESATGHDVHYEKGLSPKERQALHKASAGKLYVNRWKKILLQHQKGGGEIPAASDVKAWKAIADEYGETTMPSQERIKQILGGAE